jgi:hypothetical protein
MSRFGQCPCAAKITNVTGGFEDIASFRAETGAPVAEISDAEIVLLIESDKAHVAANRHKQHAAALYVENAKLRHLAGQRPNGPIFDRLEYSPSVWLDRVTSPAASPAAGPVADPAQRPKPATQRPTKSRGQKPSSQRPSSQKPRGKKQNVKSRALKQKF